MSKALGNIRIGTKLLLLVAVPVIAMLTISFLQLNERWQVKTEMQRMQHFVAISIKAGELVHALQIERGYSAGYIGSQGRQFGREREDAISSTNQGITAFQSATDTTSLGQNHASQLRNIFAELDKLSGLRSSVVKTSLTGLEAVNGIQSATQVNSQSVDASVSITQNATSLANESGNSLQRIVQLVGETSDQVSSIATASEEQSAASEEINRAISEVNSISDQTAEGMEESARAVNDLAEQAQELQRLVEIMAGG